MLTFSEGKEKHWYFMEAIGNDIFRESQHFLSEKDAKDCPKTKLVWTKNNGENTCSGCN